MADGAGFEIQHRICVFSQLSLITTFSNYQISLTVTANTSIGCRRVVEFMHVILR